MSGVSQTGLLEIGQVAHERFTGIEQQLRTQAKQHQRTCVELTKQLVATVSRPCSLHLMTMYCTVLRLRAETRTHAATTRHWYEFLYLVIKFIKL